MPGIPGGWELVLLLVVLVLLFGASKLPTAARSLGQSMRIFKAETKSLKSDDDGKAKDHGPGAAAQQDGTQALPPSQPPAPHVTPPVSQAPVDQAQGHHDSTR